MIRAVQEPRIRAETHLAGYLSVKPGGVLTSTDNLLGLCTRRRWTKAAVLDLHHAMAARLDLLRFLARNELMRIMPKGSPVDSVLCALEHPTEAGEMFLDRLTTPTDQNDNPVVLMHPRDLIRWKVSKGTADLDSYYTAVRKTSNGRYELLPTHDGGLADQLGHDSIYA